MKRLISTLTLCTFCISSLMADQPPAPATEQMSQPLSVDPGTEQAPEVKEVPKEDEAVSTKNSRWVDFAIAISAIAVAITALILVSKNRGK